MRPYPDQQLGLPAAHVPRPRLAEELAGASVAVIEAAAGYGKSVLAAELRRRLAVACAWVALGPPDDDPAGLASSIRRAFRASRLSDLTAALDNAGPAEWVDRLLDSLAALDEPLLLVLDDAHHLRDPATTAQLLRLARGIQGMQVMSTPGTRQSSPADGEAPPEGRSPLRGQSHRLVVTARRLHGDLETMASTPGAVSIGAAALRFDLEETRAIVAAVRGEPASPHELRTLVELTGGWPAALGIAVGQPSIDSTVPGPEVMSTLLDRALVRLDPHLRPALFQLAHLPWFSPSLATAVGGQADMFEQIVDAGVPLVRTSPGAFEMPGPVVAYLAGRAPLAAGTASLAADAYREAGRTAEAIRLLLASGLSERAGEMVSALGLHEAEDLGWAELKSVADALSASAAGPSPRVLLHLARASETSHRMDVRRSSLEFLAGAETDDPALRREVDAERARDLVWDERTRSEAAALASSVLLAASPGEEVSRARSLDALGRLRSWWSDDGPHDDAVGLFEESARIARHLGQPVWAARALVPLAMAVHFDQCRYDKALFTLDEALALLPARSGYRALGLTFRCSVLSELDRAVEAEATLEDLRSLAAALGEEWLFAYVAWTEAEVACSLGDRERTVRAVAETERHRGAWFDETPGVEFLAQGANFLDRTGEHELALEHLARARQRMAGFERVVRIYESCVLGRSGDPRRAEEVISATLARRDLAPQERWQIVLLRAYAAARRDDGTAPRLAAEAFELCRDLGIGEAPFRKEPEAAEALLPLAVAAGSRAAAELAASARTVSITLLGGFELRRGRNRLEPPAGRPAVAVRAVATAGGRMAAGELTELLWPDAPPDVGRNRLKNLLSRLRAAVGDVLVREGEAVVLGRECACDVAGFEVEAAESLAAKAAGHELRAAALARAALDRYRGDLLPEDRYEPWAAPARERLRLKHLDLLDLLARSAESAGEYEEAIRLIRRAIDAEPYDEHRHVNLARLLLSQGRAGSARSVIRRAVGVLQDLGLQPSEALTEVRHALGDP